MSGLAKIALNLGCKVSGSDLANNGEIDCLRSMGVDITIPHSADVIHEDIDLIVYSSAIKDNNVEILRGKELSINMMERAEFLGVVSQGFNNVIAVAGTHGKTTTTSMIAEILSYANFNPTIHLGGESKSLGGNTVIGGEDYFIVEACEYKESFRYLKPTIGIITNVELDHVDYYKSFQDIHNAFEKFSSNCKTVICREEDNISHNSRIVLGQEWTLKHIEFCYNGYNFNVFHNGRIFGSFRINMLGLHNVYNALNAIVCSYLLGVDLDILSQAISSLGGVARRYECIHTFESNCRLIIDYAHHPTEISASVSGIKSIYNRILYIFQPHTYTRTKALFGDFVEVLSQLENVVIYQTYPAREDYLEGGSGEDLWRVLKEKNNCLYYDNIDDISSYIAQSCDNFDCVLVLGAGDLAEKLKRTHFNV